ncbi:MAG: TetR/AcrR family transcriptional regulator [Novosphingobium sp.]|nr:TetR family transcriptional regulator [Novosphingobium sp.]
MPSESLRNRSGTRVHSKSIEKRQRILDAAAKALAKKGYSEAKLSDIAREAGTHAGSLYYYFPSREDLMKEVMNIAAGRMFAEADALIDDDSSLSPIDHVRSFIRKMIEQRISMKNDYYLRAFLLNYGQVPDHIRRKLRTKPRHTRRILTGLMNEAQAAGEIPEHVDTSAAAQFIFGATSWMTMWYEPSGPTSPGKITETFLDLMLHGLIAARRPQLEVVKDTPARAKPHKRRAGRSG